MEISQLRTLIHVAELGSLSKAADRLHIAQPALSRQISQLEKELGVRLFDRHGRGMVLTQEGEEVQRRAMRVITELAEIRPAVVGSNASLGGHISIGISASASNLLCESLVAAFRQTHPKATLRILTAYSDYLLEWLQQGELDVAAVYLLNDPKSLTDRKLPKTVRVSPLLDETFLLVGPTASALSLGAPVTFSKLEKLPLLLPSVRHATRLMLDKHAKQLGISLDIKVEIDDYSVLKALVMSGHGHTICPLAPIHEEVSDGRLRAAPLINPILTRRLLLAYPIDRIGSRLAHFAGQVITDTVESLVKLGTWPEQVLQSGRTPRRKAISTRSQKGARPRKNFSRRRGASPKAMK